MSLVWPTLGSRMAKEQNRTVIDHRSVCVDLCCHCLASLMWASAVHLYIYSVDSEAVATWHFANFVLYCI